jgi:hypothetical protein
MPCDPHIEIEIIFIDFTWVCSPAVERHGDEQVQDSSYIILEKVFSGVGTNEN